MFHEEEQNNENTYEILLTNFSVDIFVALSISGSAIPPMFRLRNIIFVISLRLKF